MVIGVLYVLILVLFLKVSKLNLLQNFVFGITLKLLNVLTLTLNKGIIYWALEEVHTPKTCKIDFSKRCYALQVNKEF